MTPNPQFEPTCSAGSTATLAAALIRLVQQFNRATDAAMLVPSEYLEVVIRRR